MDIQELNGGKCKTYLVTCTETQKAMLLDPVRDNIDRYLALLAYKGLTLDALVDTHTHADHLSGTVPLHDLTGARIIMDKHAPSPRITEHVTDGDVIKIGDAEIDVIYTPGHTPDSVSFYTGTHVFTGDVLLIGGTGRSDFAGGDAGQQFDSVQKLFTLPDETVVLPAHDYRGNTESTIGYEKEHNPRVAGRTRDEYIELMDNMNFPLPERIQEVLQPNQTAIDDDTNLFPDLARLNSVRQLDPEEVLAMMSMGSKPLLLDVREPDEYTGELGHIDNSVLVPLKELAGRSPEFEEYMNKPIACICRAGVRSTTAAAILTGLGFEQVSNLRGGMLAWNEKDLPVKH